MTMTTSKLELTPQELEKLRDISIFDILHIHNKGRRVGIPCPVHSGRNNNFNLYPNNSYFCFKCGACGSNGIDLLRDLNGYPKKMSSHQFFEVVEQLIHYL